MPRKYFQRLDCERQTRQPSHRPSPPRIHDESDFVPRRRGTLQQSENWPVQEPHSLLKILQEESFKRKIGYRTEMSRIRSSALEAALAMAWLVCWVSA